jgi:hypothetical protein
MIYLLTAIGLPPAGSSTAHIYTQTIHRTTQNKQYTEQHKILEECRQWPVFASYTLAFVLQLSKKHGKTSVRVASTEKPQFGQPKICRYWDSKQRSSFPNSTAIARYPSFRNIVVVSPSILLSTLFKI